MRIKPLNFPSIRWITTAYVTVSAVWAVIFVNALHWVVKDLYLEAIWEIGLNWAFVLITGLGFYLFLSSQSKKYKTLSGYLANLMDAMSDAAISTDSQQVIVSWNRAAEGLYGWTADEAIGKPLGEALYGGALPGSSESDRAAVPDPQRLAGEVAHRHKDGSLIPVVVSASPINDPQGDPIGALIISRDVTERIQAQEALRDSEERFRRIFEEGPLGMAISSKDREWITVNRALTKILGYAEEELLGHKSVDFIHPDDVSGAMRLTARIVAGETASFKQELRMIRKDGTIIWVHLTAFALREARGELLYGLGLIKDITDRKLAEEKLRESEERYRRLAENAPDLIFRWSMARGFEYVSPAVTAMTGYSEQDYYDDPGLGYRAIVPEDVAAYESYFSALTRGEQVTEPLVARLRRKDGQIATQELRATQVRDNQGQVTAFEGIARDVTQQQIDRARLRDLSQRLAAAHEEERRRVATELHDEAGQSLTVARVRLEIALNQLPVRFKKIRTQLDALGAALEESLRVVRGLSQELRPPLLEELGWQPALAWLCDGFARRSGLRVDYRHTGKKTRLPPAVELAIYRVAQEALTNALRHAHASRVTVVSAFAKTGLRITIKDDGRGYDPDSLRRAQGRNVGLGLLLMQERVSTVDGSLTVASQPGHGSAIIAEFPAISGEKA